MSCPSARHFFSSRAACPRCVERRPPLRQLRPDRFSCPAIGFDRFERAACAAAALVNLSASNVLAEPDFDQAPGRVSGHRSLDVFQAIAGVLRGGKHASPLANCLTKRYHLYLTRLTRSQPWINESIPFTISWNRPNQRRVREKRSGKCPPAGRNAPQRTAAAPPIELFSRAKIAKSRWRFGDYSRVGRRPRRDRRRYCEGDGRKFLVIKFTPRELLASKRLYLAGPRRCEPLMAYLQGALRNDQVHWKILERWHRRDRHRIWLDRFADRGGDHRSGDRGRHEADQHLHRGRHRPELTIGVRSRRGGLKPDGAVAQGTGSRRSGWAAIYPSISGRPPSRRAQVPLPGLARARCATSVLWPVEQILPTERASYALDRNRLQTATRLVRLRDSKIVSRRSRESWTQHGFRHQISHFGHLRRRTNSARRG